MFSNWFNSTVLITIKMREKIAVYKFTGECISKRLWYILCMSMIFLFTFKFLNCQYELFSVIVINLNGTSKKLVNHNA